MSVKETPEENDYQKCFAYQLGRYNGCSGASGEKFKKVCRHCPFWFEYCKRFKEVKAMAEYIELINRLRQEAEWEAYLQPHSANETPKLLSEAADVIEKLSKERKKGKWISHLLDDGSFWANYCSECGVYLPYGLDWKPNGCPNCFADMRGET